MAVALQILSNIIRGSYCHYEVFEVYGDTVLNDSLRLALQMCLAIPQDGKRQEKQRCGAEITLVGNCFFAAASPRVRITSEPSRAMYGLQIDFSASCGFLVDL